MQIDRYISELLYDHDCVIVPGLGGFLANFHPARVNTLSSTISPPSRVIAFNARLKNSDGLLTNAIARGTNTSYAVASDYAFHEVNGIMKHLEQGRKVILSNIGTLFLDEEKNIQFKPDATINYLNDSFGLATLLAPVIDRSAETGANAAVIRTLPRMESHSTGTLLKWAAVLLPFAALSVWNIMHPQADTNTGFASLGPATKISVLETPARISLTERNIADGNTYVHPYWLNKSLKDAGTAQPGAFDRRNPAGIDRDLFYVIAGSFNSSIGAERIYNQLVEEGFSPVYLGATKRGWHMVSVASFPTKAEALGHIGEYQSSIPGAWIYPSR